MFKNLKRFCLLTVEKINNTNSYLLGGIIFIFLVGLSILTQLTMTPSCDMAEYLNNPLRILNGEIPYRDFWLLFTPGEAYFPALIYKIFGLNIDFVRFISIIFSSGTAIFAFYFGKILFKNNFESLLLTFLFFFAGIISTYCGPDYIHLYLLFILLSAIFLVKFFKSDKTIDIFLSGFLIGCSFIFRFYEVGAAFAGLGLAFLLFLILNKKSFKYSIKAIIYYALGVTIVIVGLLLAFHQMLPTFYKEVAMESVDNGTSMNLPYFYDGVIMSNALGADFHDLFVAKDKGAIIKIVLHLFKVFPYYLYYLIPFISIFLLIIYLLTKPPKKELSIALVFFSMGDVHVSESTWQV